MYKWYTGSVMEMNMALGEGTIRGGTGTLEGQELD